MHTHALRPRPVIFLDSILSRVKGEKHLDGYTVYIRKIKGENVAYDGMPYAHCDKIRDGIANLAFTPTAARASAQDFRLTPG